MVSANSVHYRFGADRAVHWLYHYAYMHNMGWLYQRRLACLDKQKFKYIPIHNVNN
jgi:hypothetical protein